MPDLMDTEPLIGIAFVGCYLFADLRMKYFCTSTGQAIHT
jgi:hypothetical protein